MVETQRRYVLTDREVWLMREAAKRANSMLCLDRQRFLGGLQMDFNDAKHAQMDLLITELQREVRKYDPTVVLGYNHHKDVICWYASPLIKGVPAPYTPVPFLSEQDMPEIKWPDPIAEINQAYKHEWELKVKERDRIVAGRAHVKKPWYKRAPGEPKA